ncbi:GNAT family N-acetyltransferase [Streptoalloteichus hindustanus]|uniref:Protein N-acetyltransferase, RimJ/RimL family n=1 Tax=Streptoalloteichus hindustanus TaxID=2017 RepID=A0A1M4YS80_STRHI|nr:GNAT family protein [Streptoalloteichus hindustanus]SHF08548.1 Protein N-acetyltransferase, RimJ/RimL family [Streptoalloteichus hindustanus]
MTSIWTGSKVRLRGIEPEDWATFQRMDEHSADLRSVDMLYPPRSAAGYRKWAADQSTHEPTGDDFQLAVESLADGVLVGAMSTLDTDRRAGRFSYGVGICRDHQGRGYAKDAAVVLLTYMFGERRYHKCEVGILAFNEASIALHRSLGFQVEGRLRDHEFYAGRHRDMVLMGMTVDEFADRYPFHAL